MARIARQGVPAPPDHYDQQYIAKLADALNRYMFQRQALGELVGARFIMTDPPTIPPDATTQFVTGTLVLRPLPGAPAGTYYLTVVQETDP